jgi:HD-GYP domain-containing protein (c-di-GMP phosphodiesterase class II)
MPPSPTPTPAPVRLAELVAALSLVSDLGMGRPMERALRQTVIALRLAAASEGDERLGAAVYYTSLLTWVGCAVDTSEMAELFGDETELYAEANDDDLGARSRALFVARRLGRGGSALRRVGMVGRFLLTAGRPVQRTMHAHALALGELAERLGLGPEVARPLLQSFERWDGAGIPGAAGGDELAPAIRVVHLADTLEAFHHAGGADAALDVARQRRGTQFDPDLVDRFCRHHREILAGLDDIAAWDEVIALDPRLDEVLDGERLDTALEAVADLADLKSPLRLGHSRGVAGLAAEAARSLGMTASTVTLVRRAGLVHDVGMVGVPSGVWDATAPWSWSQRERARTHPYLTERVLARTATLAEIGRCAALHHERLDGSGYPRGVRGDDIPPPARVLAAADVYHALGEDRPHRPARSPDEAAAHLRDEVRAGRLDGEAVNAVLGAAGHRVRRRPDRAGGLTPRETDVLVLLARGLTNPQIAAELVVSRKTVSTHLQSIYAKLGVGTRTEAALYAMRHDLLGPPPAGR